MIAATLALKRRFRLMMKIVAPGNEVRDDKTVRAARERSPERHSGDCPVPLRARPVTGYLRVGDVRRASPSDLARWAHGTARTTIRRATGDRPHAWPERQQHRSPSICCSGVFASVAAGISAQGLTGFARDNMGLTGPWPYLLFWPWTGPPECARCC